MLSKLLLAPARIGLGLTRVTLGLSCKLTESAVGTVVHAVQSRFPQGQSPDPSEPATAADDARDSGEMDDDERDGREVPPTSGSEVTPPSPLVPADITSPDELPDTPLTRQDALAKTSDDDDQVVAEVSEPGAQDGAGAALHVNAPWDGYDTEDVDSVTARIAGADAAELALVELYEQTHAQRKPVRDAADRRLRELSERQVAFRATPTGG
jgi:hypothetical protein